MASLLRGLIGSGTQQVEPSSIETVEKLCNRVTTATLPDDRRDAVRGLKAMSKQFRLEVGTQALDILLDVIRNDRTDLELLEYAMDTLLNLVETGDGSPEDLGVQFSEIFLKKPEHIHLVLDCLLEFEFKVRMASVRVLTCLLQNKCSVVQQMILESPQGISRLMDIIADSREVIRNDGLLLMMHLTKDNAQIQKIVAFENAFERLLDIVEGEGYSDGGIIVKDCLVIMFSMLNGNNSNQAFFREASLIPRLVPFLDIEAAGDWKQERIDIVVLTLKVIRVLVSPNNPNQPTSACQKSMQQCGLLKLLLKVIFSSGVHTDVLQECIRTVAEVIRGNLSNQQMFDQLQTPSTPPRPAPLAILMSMVSDKQPFQLRLAALYCFQCYIHKNQELQAKVIDTLLPSTEETTDITAGQVLCTGLFGPDPVGHWCAAAALAKCLSGSPQQQQQLLRVQLSMKDHGQVTLLQQLSGFLMQTQLQLSSHIGFLMLMVTWLQNCPLAVSQFLDIASIIPHLTSLAEAEKHSEGDRIIRGLCALLLGACLSYHDGTNTQYTKDTLHQIIAHRIGEETFLECLSAITATEHFTKAARNPQVSPSSDGQLYFDYSFVQVFKQVQDNIQRTLDPTQVDSLQSTPSKAPPAAVNATSMEDHDDIVTSYKELIRDQDLELTALRAKHTSLEEDFAQRNAILLQQVAEIQVLKEQLQSVGKASQGSTDPPVAMVAELQQTIADLQSQVGDLQRMGEGKDTQIAQLQSQVSTLQSLTPPLPNGGVASPSHQALQDTIDTLRADNEALLTEKTALDEELSAIQRNQSLMVKEPPSGNQEKIASLELELKKVTAAFKELSVKSGTMEKEQEDLLVLLADNDARVKKYKALLRENNLEPPQSEEEDEDEEEEEESEEEN